MTGVYIRLHRWRGFSRSNVEPDLFHYVAKLGFVTVYLCKVCLLDAYRKLRATVQEAIALADHNNREGR